LNPEAVPRVADRDGERVFVAKKEQTLERQRNAFTLIELLIVVAVIGILAAISIPNYLEARTRAKVSRAIADLRTYCIGVEQYRLDHDAYPLDGDDHPVFDPALWDQAAQFARLTTPTAYVPSPMFDPFGTRKSSDPTMLLLFPHGTPYPYSYITFGDIMTHKGKPTFYGVLSLGPSGVFDSAANQGIGDTYDPSNGTVSRGDVIYYGPTGTTTRPGFLD